MIARTWRGQTMVPDADAYVRHLETSVFPRLQGIAGHAGAYLLRREQEGRVDFLVITLWESMEAVRRFAGATPDVAVVEPEARAVLAEFDARVEHYDVVLGSNVGG